MWSDDPSGLAASFLVPFRRTSRSFLSAGGATPKHTSLVIETPPPGDRPSLLRFRFVAAPERDDRPLHSSLEP